MNRPLSAKALKLIHTKFLERIVKLQGGALSPEMLELGQRKMIADRASYYKTSIEEARSLWGEYFPDPDED